MFEEKDDEMIRQMLGKATHRTAPAGLGDTIMQKIQADAARRIRRRLILAMTLKFACLAVLIGLFARPVIIHGISMESLTTALKDAGQTGTWISKNVYFLFPLLVLLLGRRAFLRTR